MLPYLLPQTQEARQAVLDDRTPSQPHPLPSGPAADACQQVLADVASASCDSSAC